MSKERLEEIEERVLVDKVYYKYLDGTKGHWGKVYTLSEEDYNYLKEQAERVQELERKIERLRTGIERAIKETSCDDTWDYLNRLLEGKETTDLPYRIGGRGEFN